MRVLRVVDLGRQPYGDVLDLQRRLCQARIQGSLTDDLLLLVEHPDAITLGRGTRTESMPLTAEQLGGLGYEVHEIERGGDVTYHGPGQLVGYPILDLSLHRQDLHWYLRQLEAVLINALARMAIRADRVEGLTGVWTKGRKIASIGIHVKRWVTFHGFALNVTTDLARFSAIVPCGIDGVDMTSVARELGPGGVGRPLEALMRDAVIEAMGRAFERETIVTSLDGLRPALAPSAS